MRVGTGLPQYGPQAAHVDRVAAFARDAEAAGAASLWVADRLLAPTDPEVPYPGLDHIPAVFDARQDSFALLAAAATATSTVALGSSVLNLPWYPAAFAARILNTIDALSGGRLLPGYGTGWSPEEYRAMGLPFTGRGRRLDETLDVLAAFGGDDPIEYHGTHVEVPRTRNTPSRRLPVYLGGYGAAALRRVGERGDGWLPAVMAGARGAVDVVREQQRQVHAAATAAGRDPGAVDTVLRINFAGRADAAAAARTATEVCAATGIGHVFADFASVTEHPDQALELTSDLLTRLG